VAGVALGELFEDDRHRAKPSHPPVTASVEKR
jgi:hypothetical protein